MGACAHHLIPFAILTAAAIAARSVWKRVGLPLLLLM